MSQRIRTFHRWISMLFMLAVIANVVAMASGTPPAWVTYAPLLPLFLLMFTGVYLFFLPYVARRRAAQE